jgi:hypothetical protein
MKFTTKDSGKRQEYESGMRRDVQEGKPRYDLIDRAYLKRWAELMERGASKYGEDNWRLANSQKEVDRFKASAFRHFISWMNGEQDEDHSVAIAFNVAAAEYVKEKL